MSDLTADLSFYLGGDGGSTTFTWQQLIDRAKVYLAEDHEEDSGWIAPDKWLILANVEYAELYKRWVRQGFVSPPTIDTTFAAPTVTVPGTLAVIGVAEDMGSYMRVLTPAQSGFGRSPFWRSPTEQAQGLALYWSAASASDRVAIQLDPPVAGNYVVRTIPTVLYATDATATLDVPYGTDERIVLGIARRAHLKDSTASAALERLIQLHDAETALSAFGKIDGDGPRVRRVRPSAQRVSRMRGSLSMIPRGGWLYL